MASSRSGQPERHLRNLLASPYRCPLELPTSATLPEVESSGKRLCRSFCRAAGYRVHSGHLPPAMYSHRASIAFLQSWWLHGWRKEQTLCLGRSLRQERVMRKEELLGLRTIELHGCAFFPWLLWDNSC